MFQMHNHQHESLVRLISLRVNVVEFAACAIALPLCTDLAVIRDVYVRAMLGDGDGFSPILDFCRGCIRLS